MKLIDLQFHMLNDKVSLKTLVIWFVCNFNTHICTIQKVCSVTVLIYMELLFQGNILKNKNIANKH